MKKEHFRSTLWWMICMTIGCVGLIWSTIILIIYRNVGQKWFFIYLNVCLFLHLYFMRLCRGTFMVRWNIHLISLLQIVHKVPQRKNFENRPIPGEDMDKSKSAMFRSWATRYTDRVRTSWGSTSKYGRRKSMLAYRLNARRARCLPSSHT